MIKLPFVVMFMCCKKHTSLQLGLNLETSLFVFGLLIVKYQTRTVISERNKEKTVIYTRLVIRLIMKAKKF
jgi:hypothetical protein